MLNYILFFVRMCYLEIIAGMRFRGWGRRGPAPLFPPIYGPSPGTTSSGPVFACRPMSFDLALCEASFPRIKELDDTDLAQVFFIAFLFMFQ